jgi:hypothetical protein
VRVSITARQEDHRVAERVNQVSRHRLGVKRLDGSIDTHKPWTDGTRLALAVQISPTMWFKSKAPTLGDFEQLVLLGVARLELQESAYGAAIRQEIHARSGRDVSINGRPLYGEYVWVGA